MKFRRGGEISWARSREGRSVPDRARGAGADVRSYKQSRQSKQNKQHKQNEQDRRGVQGVRGRRDGDDMPVGCVAGGAAPCVA
jgi:hypothetical protein